MSDALISELRAGAAKLRLLADAARGGDWRAELLPPDARFENAAHWVTTRAKGGSATTYKVVADCPLSQDDAAYIEAMQPRMGLAVATLLATAADLLESYPDLGQPHVEDKPCTDLACRVVYDAVAVVRALPATGKENPDD
jgi:hypothetical protein